MGLLGLGLKRPNRSWPVGVNDPEDYGKAMLALIEQLGADRVAFGTDISGVGDSGSVNTFGEVQLLIQRAGARRTRCGGHRQSQSPELRQRFANSPHRVAAGRRSRERLDPAGHAG